MITSKDSSVAIVVFVFTSIIPLLIDLLSASRLSSLLAWRPEILLVVVVAYYGVQTYYYFSSEWNPKIFFRFRFISLLFLVLVLLLDHFVKEPSTPLLAGNNIIGCSVFLIACAYQRIRKSFPLEKTNS